MTSVWLAQNAGMVMTAAELDRIIGRLEKQRTFLVTRQHLIIGRMRLAKVERFLEALRAARAMNAMRRINHAAMTRRSMFFGRASLVGSAR